MNRLPIIFALLSLLLFSACAQKASTETPNTQPTPTAAYSNLSDLNPTDTLYRIQMEEAMDAPCGYINAKGDTIIPMEYNFCFLETVTTYAIVGDIGKPAQEIYAIDRKQNRLYELYWFDNGPDFVSDGLFRFKRNGKIGYAKPNGEVAIKAQFACANQFEDGKARVSLDCELKKVGEVAEMQSDGWFYINKAGEKIE